MSSPNMPLDPMPAPLNVSVPLLPRPPLVLFFGLAALYIIFLFPSPEFNAYNKNDASLFHTMGLNLARSGRYTTDICPGESYGQHGTWPPLFPALLASVILASGDSWIAIKLLMVGMGLGNLFLLRKLLKVSVEGEWAVLLVGISPMYFLFSHTTMTEVPFMLASTATLLAAQRAFTLRGVFLAGVLAVIAFFTRGYAAVFVPAGIIYFLSRREGTLRHRIWVAVLFVGPLVAAIVLWGIYTRSIVASGHLDYITSHFGNGSGIISGALRSPLAYAREFYWWHARFPSHMLLSCITLHDALTHDALVPLSVVLLLFVAGGWWWNVRQGASLYDWWFLCGVGLLLSIRGTSARYWLTYLPFMFYYLLTYVAVLARNLRGLRRLSVAVLMVGVTCGGAGLARHLMLPDELRFLNGYWRELRDASLWARDHTPPRSQLIVAVGDNQCHVASGRCITTLGATTANAMLHPDVFLLAPRAGLSSVPFPKYHQSLRQADGLLSQVDHIPVWSGKEVILYRLLPSKRKGDEIENSQRQE